MTNDLNNKDTHNSELENKIRRDLENLREEHVNNSENRQVGDLLRELGLRGEDSKERTTSIKISDKLFFDDQEVNETPTEVSVADELATMAPSREEAIDDVPVEYPTAQEVADETDLSQTEAFQPKEESEMSAEAKQGSLVTRFAHEDLQEDSAVGASGQEEFEEPDLDATLIHQAIVPSSHQADQKVELEETLVTDSLDDQEDQEAPIPSRRSDVRHRKQQDRAAKKIVATVVLLVLFALAIAGVAGYSYIKSSLDPINAKATDYVQVEIPQGSTTHEIGQILVKKKLIKNATIFNYYAKLKSYNNFQSGFYNLSQNMSVDDLAKALQETGTATAQKPVAGKVLIVEGLTLEQIAKAVTDNVKTEKKGDKTPFKEADFLATVKNPDFIKRMTTTYPKLFASLPAANSGVKYQLEGYLFPATYDYSSDMTVEQLAEKMIATMDEKMQPYYDQLAAKNLTVNELLTLASLVEKEGSTDEDRRNIAGVFYNRLNANMPLQSNIAILYAMGKLGEKTTLKEDATIDTNLNSPYNVYINLGLMPGPVDNPSLAAIDATLNQTKNNYLYFVADVTTGTVYYSTTLEEHNQKVEQYVNKKVNQ